MSQIKLLGSSSFKDADCSILCPWVQTDDMASWFRFQEFFPKILATSLLAVYCCFTDVSSCIVWRNTVMQSPFLSRFFGNVQYSDPHIRIDNAIILWNTSKILFWNFPAPFSLKSHLVNPAFQRSYNVSFPLWTLMKVTEVRCSSILSACTQY